MILIIAIGFIVVLLSIVYLFLQSPTFGAVPEGKRKSIILNSPNFRNGEFQNLSNTPALAPNTSYIQIIKDYFFGNYPVKPSKVLPAIKTDLSNFKDSINSIVWFGHSSYLLNIEGKVVLVDPVLSGYASPVNFIGKNFIGSNIYSPQELPSIDLLLITHDHYDHLDYETMIKIKDKVKLVVTGLGVGAHLEHWGYQPQIIKELDWWNKFEIDSLEIVSTPARHFSGRKFKRNQTIWTSFVIKTNGINLFIGGDSGYDMHFKQIGDQYGPFDLAILECGQFNERWPYIHMFPEQTAQAAKDLHAKIFMPVHWGKFSLALHPWNESIKTVTNTAKQLELACKTQMIGEITPLLEHDNSVWWDFE